MPNHPPQRIVSLQPSVTVTLAQLGALERVVACTKYCVDVCPEIASGARKIVTDSWNAQAKEILEARPDLVIAAVPYQIEAIAEMLKAGVRFLALAPHCLEDIYSDIALLASMVGERARGGQLISEMRSEIDAVHEKTRGCTVIPVFCEEWGKPIIASQLWVTELIQACGGEVIVTPAKQITADDVLDANPEVIVAAWCGAGDRVPLRKIIHNRGWQQTAAAKARRVFCVRDEFLNTPAATLINGLKCLAWALHPDLFERPPGIRSIAEERLSRQHDVVK
jgi:iron complex transport system substrate-binding protein